MGTTLDDVEVEVLGERLLTLRVCAATEDGDLAARVASRLWPPGTSVNEWRYDPDGDVIEVDPSPTVPCDDLPGRWHHVLYC